MSIPTVSNQNLFVQLNTENIKNSFYQNRYKALTVTGRFVSSHVIALACKVCSIICIFFPAISHFFNFHYRHYSDKAKSSYFLYYFFKNNVINFGHNSSGISKPLKVDNDTFFKKTFGKERFDQLKKISSEKVKIEKEGICMGICIDYLRNYSKARQIGYDAFSSVQMVSHYFKDKGTQSSHFFQVAYCTSDQEARKQQREKFLQEQEKKMKMFMNLSEEEQEKMIHTFKNTPNLSEKSVKNELNALSASYLKQVIPDVKLKFLGTSKYKNEETQTKKISEHLEQLPIGNYILGVNEHAIVYIKESNEQQFFHDPNYGSIHISSKNDREKFTSIIQKLYQINNGISVDTSKHELEHGIT